MRRDASSILLFALIPIALVFGLWLGGHPDALPGPVRDVFVGDDEARVVDQAIEEVHEGFVKEIGRGKLADAAIAGMVSALDDRFSTYFSRAQYDRFQASSNGRFSGVGMSVDGTRDGLLVREVYDDSPAKRAGIRPRDVIVAAGGKSLRGVEPGKGAERIRGRPGTEVTLRIRSRGRTRTETLTRTTVTAPVVASRLRTLPGGTKVAQVALAQFSSGAHGFLREAIEKRLKQGAKGVLLDLRHNPGGLLEESRLVASLFIPEGPIVSTRGRTQPSRTLNASGNAIADDVPVVVLVDRASASASEVVTGALQDRRRATVVGQRTFGKGVFQEVTRLPNGGALDITVGQYFTPKGHNLGGVGVKPDVRASDDPDTEADEAVAAALKALDAKVR